MPDLSRSVGNAAPRLRRTSSMEFRPILLVVGILLVILSLFMAPAMVADMAAGREDWQVFLAAAGVTLFAGVSLVLMNRGPRLSEFSGRQAFVLVTLAWVTLTLFA